MAARKGADSVMQTSQDANPPPLLAGAIGGAYRAGPDGAVPQPRAAESFAKATIDAVPMHICVLDRTGTILLVNQSWRAFFDQNAAAPGCADYQVGANYLAVCESVVGVGAQDARAMAEAIREVSAGRRQQFSFEYACHSPAEQRWFIARVSRFQGDSGNVVIAHENITERKQTERALLELNRDFENFLEKTTDFVYFKDKDSRIRFCSQTMADITGHASWRDMIGKHDREVFPPDTAAIYSQEERSIFVEGKPLLNKVDPYYDAQGRRCYVQTNKWPLFDEAGHLAGIFGISRDITDQRDDEIRLQLAARAELKRVNALLSEDIWQRERVEQALLASEERFRELAELSSDWWWEQDEHFRFTHFSFGANEKGSAWPELLLGAARWEQSVDLHASDWAGHRMLLERHLPFRNFEYKRLAGSVAQWISSSGKPLFDADGNFIGYRGTSRDITDRKQTEEALRQSRAELRNWAAHQERVKEEERKRIARDIHDDLGQNLMALRLDVSRLAEGGAQPIERWSAAALTQIDQSMKAVRAIINDLRPPVLDLGLHAALEWQAKRFARRSGTSCELYIDHEECALPDELATALFRIVQESLSNIMRHAKARHTQIEMRRADGCLALRIADDGVGLPADYSRGANSFGLIGIEERVRAFGGHFRITSAPGQGMAIEFSIPL
jgi:PAS domain S-box-containing protein